MHFCERKCLYFDMKNSLNLVPRDPIDKNPVLVVWRRICDNQLSGPMLVRFTDAYMRHYGETSFSWRHHVSASRKMGWLNELLLDIRTHSYEYIFENGICFHCIYLCSLINSWSDVLWRICAPVNSDSHLLRLCAVTFSVPIKLILKPMIKFIEW